MSILLTRPLAESQKLKDFLESHQISCVIDPLIDIRPLTVPIPIECKGLILTSTNAVFALKKINFNPNSPIFCVGAQTAQSVEKLGFSNILVGQGTAKTLISLIEKMFQCTSGPLLYLAGKPTFLDMEEILKKKGYDIKTVKVYDAVASQHFLKETATYITQKRISHVLFYSQRTAKIFINHIQQEKLESFCCTITALCLSPSIREILTLLPFRKVQVLELSPLGILAYLKTSVINDYTA